MKVKPFDTTTLSESSIEGMCEYTAVEVPGDFSVSFKPIACGEAGMVTIKSILSTGTALQIRFIRVRLDFHNVETKNNNIVEKSLS